MKATSVNSLPKKSAFLHFESKRIDPGTIQVDYELVIPLGEVDCRGTFDHKGRKNRPKNHSLVWLDRANNRRIPMGRTKVGTSWGEYPFFNGQDAQTPPTIELPFRDGAHCGWDNESLGGGLDIYYTTEKGIYRLSK